LTKKDSVDYVKFLAAEAAKYNMSTGLKNAGDIIKSVLPYVQFSVNEQCVEYSECETFAAFIKAKKNTPKVHQRSKRPTARSFALRRVRLRAPTTSAPSSKS